MITAGQFVENFPMFGDSTVYPAPTISFWLGVAYQLLQAPRWGTLLDQGAQLFAAHNLVLGMQQQAAANVGGVPGQATGVVSAKSVDGVSISYDVGAGTYPDAGFFNTSTFGTQFWFLVMMVGAGPVQLGVGYAPPLAGGGAWFGPIVDQGGPGYP